MESSSTCAPDQLRDGAKILRTLEARWRADVSSQRDNRGRGWWSAVLPGAMALLLIACAGPSRPPATPTPPAGPVVLATAIPTALPTATRTAPTPIAPPMLPSTVQPVQTETVRVTNTGGQGLTLRQTPGGAVIRGLPDGTLLSLTGEEQVAGDRLWRKVRDAQGREGWVAAEFLTAEGVGGPSPVTIAAASPTPGPESVALASATPTWPVPLIPTATLRPPPPTRTPRTQESPAPIPAPTAPPLIVPGIVVTRPSITPGSRP